MKHARHITLALVHGLSEPFPVSQDTTAGGPSTRPVERTLHRGPADRMPVQSRIQSSRHVEDRKVDTGQNPKRVRVRYWSKSRIDAGP